MRTSKHSIVETKASTKQGYDATRLRYTYSSQVLLITDRSRLEYGCWVSPEDQTGSGAFKARKWRSILTTLKSLPLLRRRAKVHALCNAADRSIESFVPCIVRVDSTDWETKDAWS